MSDFTAKIHQLPPQSLRGSLHCFPDPLTCGEVAGCRLPKHPIPALGPSCRNTRPFGHRYFVPPGYNDSLGSRVVKWTLLCQRSWNRVLRFYFTNITIIKAQQQPVCQLYLNSGFRELKKTFDADAWIILLCVQLKQHKNHRNGDTLTVFLIVKRYANSYTSRTT